MKVWFIGENTDGPYEGRVGEVVAVVGANNYDIRTDIDELMRNVPFYVVSYPNEKRCWKDYFKEGQRVRLDNQYPCTILNVEDDDRGRTRLALRDLGTGHVHMNVSPSQVSWDNNYFLF